MKLCFHKILFISIFFIFASTSCANEVNDIDNQELKQLMQQGVAVIDVRTTSEWKKTGVIKDSHLIMFYDEKGKYDMNAWLAEVDNVASKDQPVVLLCHSGSRSKKLAKYLVKELGYNKVYNVQKGIIHWLRKDNPTVALQ